MLFNGKEIRVGNDGGDQVELSFKELFREINRKTNLSFSIEPSPTGYSNPFQLRLEPTEFFEQDDEILTLDNVNNILMSFNTSELYSNVEVGSRSFDDDVVLSYPPLNFKAFKEENYTVLGQCNVDKTLNLVSSYIIDTNIIEDILLNSEEKYDKRIFIVVTDGTECIKYKEYDDPISEGHNYVLTAFKLTDFTFPFIIDGVTIGDMAVNMITGATAEVTAVTNSVLDLDADIFALNDLYQIRTAPYNYNHPLTNVEVVTRFLGGLPNSVVKYINDGVTAAFFAGGFPLFQSAAIFPFTLDPMIYGDDSTPPFFDDGGNYDTSNGEYTVPSPGLYGFKAKTHLYLTGSASLNIATNGDFTNFLTGWEQSTVSNATGTILVDPPPQVRYYSIRLTAWQSYLRQYVVVKPYTSYKIRFKAKCLDLNYFSQPKPFTVTINGLSSVNVSNSDWETKEIILNYTSNAAPLQYIDFRFTNGGSVSLDDIEILEGITFGVTQSIVRMNSSGVVQQTFPTFKRYPIPSTGFDITDTLFSENTFSVFQGEKIKIKLQITRLSGEGGQVLIKSENTPLNTIQTTFETILTEDGGGSILPTDPVDYPIYKYKFEKAISFADFQLLRDNPERAVLFSKSETNHIFGWRNSIDWDRKTGVATFDLRSKTKIKADC